MIKFFKKKKVLITGATGFKGSWLSLWLNNLGSKVYAIGYNPNYNDKLYGQLGLKKIIPTKIIDIRNYQKLEKYIKKVKPEIVFHLAAQPIIFTGYNYPKYTYEVNSLGTLNMLEIIKKNNFVKSTIFVTSDKCYESNNSTKGFVENDKLGGIDPYSGSKACAEIIIKTYIESFFKKNKKIGVASARAGNVIGGGDWSKNRLIPDAIRSLKAKKKIIIRNPNFNRPWQHVLEPLYGYLILAEKLYKNPKKFSGAWNFGTKKNTVTDVETVISKIIKNWGSGEYKKNKSVLYEQKNLQLNILKAQKNLNWSPKLSIDQSIRITTEWYKKIITKNEDVKRVTEDQINQYIKKW